MHYVSLIVEFLRGRPAVVFWTAALSQAALWVIVPALFYSAPPGDVPLVLAVGHEFRLGSFLGPPLAFWLAETAFRIAGIYGVYMLAQACIVLGFWAVFQLGRSIVGTRHAVLAILMMSGVAAFAVPSVNFGPAVLAIPLWALALLHYWRAVGEGKRGYWFLLGLDLGLLLLTSYAGVILLAVLLLFSISFDRGRRAFRDIEPWLALLLTMIVVFPHAVWLRASWPLLWPGLGEEPSHNTALPALLWLAAVLVLSHFGVGLLAVLAGGWRVRQRERAPEIERNPVEPLARLYVYVFALAPMGAALAVVLWLERLGPLSRVGPLLVLSSLALIVAAGDTIYLYRERMVSMTWVGLLALPPALVVIGLIVLPWTFAYELKIGQPAGAMGQFFTENFQRRVGRPLPLVAGDASLATLIAISSPTRPSVYFSGTPERSPWANAAMVRANGGILVWPATDTAGSVPATLKAEFPELVPELPRAFARPIQGLLPLLRVGWGVIRPQGSPR